jgi:hypothetical protein
MFRGVVLIAGLVGAIASSVAAARVSSFQLQLSVAGSDPQQVACPANATPDTSCRRLAGSGTARGLGSYQASAVVVQAPRAGGGFDSTVTGSLQTSRGTLSFAGNNQAEPAGKLTYAISIIGSAGFATASGTGSLIYIGSAAGNGSFVIEGTLDPESVFDLSPPAVTLAGVKAHSLGRGRYALTVHYLATDNTPGPLLVRLTAVGTSKPLATGRAPSSLHATVRVRSGVRRIALRLTVTDTSANSTTRAVSVALK